VIWAGSGWKHDRHCPVISDAQALGQWW